MSDCVFCKIVQGELPSAKVYEDNDILAFLDIKPINPGHVLVIPKKHFQDVAKTPADELAKMIVVAQKIGQVLIDGLGVEGFNIGANNGRAAGQLVLHTHFHVIPRVIDDGLKNWTDKQYREGEKEKIAERIRGALSK